MEAGVGSRKILLDGFVRNDAWNWISGIDIVLVLAMEIGSVAMIQDETGELGGYYQPIGYAIAPTIMFFRPQHYQFVM